MKKLVLPVAFAAMLLAGCGNAPSLAAPNMLTANAASAQSAAGVAAGIRGMFLYDWQQMDVTNKGFVTVDEFTPMVNAAEMTGASAPTAQAQFAQMDKNADGKLTKIEFMALANRTPVIQMFRQLAEVKFAQLDTNGDHYLEADELANGPVTMEQVDTLGKGKVTESQFENALAVIASQTGNVSLLVPPAPQPPAPPAPQPPAPQPPAPQPAPAQSAAPAPAPATGSF